MRVCCVGITSRRMVQALGFSQSRGYIPWIEIKIDMGLYARFVSVNSY